MPPFFSSREELLQLLKELHLSDFEARAEVGTRSSSVFRMQGVGPRGLGFGV